MKTLVLNYSDLASGKSMNALKKAFAKTGTFVVTAETDNKEKKSAGVAFKTINLSFNDGQKISLDAKSTGDVFSVRLNGSVLPIKNHEDLGKAVSEIITAMDKSRKKFQARQTKVKVELPKGIKSTAKRKIEVLRDRIAELDGQIKEATARRDSLKVEMGLDSANWNEGKSGPVESGREAMYHGSEVRVKRVKNGIVSYVELDSDGNEIGKSKDVKISLFLASATPFAMDSVALDGVTYNKNVYFNEKKEISDVPYGSVAYVAWEYGKRFIDYYLMPLEESSRDEFGLGVFRKKSEYSGDGGNGSTIKIDPKTMTAFHVDQSKYLDSDEVVWADKIKLKQLVILNKAGFEKAYSGSAMDYTGQPRDEDGRYAEGKKGSIKAGLNKAKFALKKAFRNPFRAFDSALDSVSEDAKMLLDWYKGRYKATGNELIITASDAKGIFRARVDGDYLEELNQALKHDGMITGDSSDGYYLTRKAFDAVRPSQVKIGDTVHHPELNRTGTVRKYTKIGVEVRTTRGLEEWDFDDIEMVDDALDSAASSLDNPAYTTEMKLPKQSGKRTAINALTASDGAKILVTLNPEWSKADHAKLAKEHGELEKEADKKWTDLVEREFEKLFGRKYKFTDYKVSGIARSEFPSDVKDTLRELSRESSAHSKLSVAHKYASKHYGRAMDAVGGTVSFRIDMDTNGNRILVVKDKEDGSFSIQTNQNLPYVHSEYKNKGPVPTSDKKVVEEIKEFIAKHGSARQKKIVAGFDKYGAL